MDHSAVNPIEITTAFFYKFILDHIGDVIWVVDLDMNMIFISESVRAWGYTPEEMINTNCSLRLDQNFIQKAKDLIQMELKRDAIPGLKPDRSVRVEYEVVNGQNRDYIHQIEGVCTGFRNGEGKLIGFLGIARDMTEKKEREKIENEKLKMGTIVTLISKIHNRLAQPLQAMFGYCKILESKNKDEAATPYFEKLKNAQKEIEDLFGLMRQLDSGNLYLLNDKSNNGKT